MVNISQSSPKAELAHIQDSHAGLGPLWAERYLASPSDGSSPVTLAVDTWRLSGGRVLWVAWSSLCNFRSWQFDHKLTHKTSQPVHMVRNSQSYIHGLIIQPTGYRPRPQSVTGLYLEHVPQRDVLPRSTHDHEETQHVFTTLKDHKELQSDRKRPQRASKGLNGQEKGSKPFQDTLSLYDEVEQKMRNKQSKRTVKRPEHL